MRANGIRPGSAVEAAYEARAATADGVVRREIAGVAS
jgi:hypothetical protein